MDMEITVLRFKLRALEDMKLPDHPGSTFRGAFGHGLYNICCSLKKKNCDNCNLRSNCAYSILFNPFLTAKEKADSSGRFHNKPRPFIFKYPIIKELYKKGENVEFDIYLFGYLNNFIPFIIESWRHLQEDGIGANRGKFILEAVWIENKVKGISERVFYYEDNKIQNCNVTISNEDIKKSMNRFEGINKIKLFFETPVLLKYKKNYIKKMEFSILLRNLFRRLSSLSCFYGKEQLAIDFNDYIKKSEKIQIENDQTNWIHWKRLSNRQRRKIDMYGLTGEITYTGDLDSFLKYLIWGQYTNVGKNTAFAQGAYRVLSDYYK